MIPVPADLVTVRLRVRGVVQGVGFRPFVYRLARRYGLSGWVLNDPEGVLIEAAGPAEAVAAFARAVAMEAPAAARVDAVIETERRAGTEGGDFFIAGSAGSDDVTTLISPDLAICEACLRELFDPRDPRYLYPYITCTECGPRYSIISALPYDRSRTTMAGYPLCARCGSQYDDPNDRRFHAQPVACGACGPGVWLRSATGREEARGDQAVRRAAEALREGRIVALKGLGGYHLACDARDAAAVSLLRERKYRKEKPFALMAKGLEALAGHVVLEGGSRELLESVARPIVLLPKGQRPLPAALAPDNAELGVMLPYTPLQHLLFAAGAPDLLVMTSANRSSEPIAYRDEDAFARLAGLADLFLVGERPIARRVDDSVAAVMAGERVLFRRARGYAPAPVARDPRFAGRPILALGAGLRNTVTLATEGYAFASQHLGDLDDLDTFEAFRQTVTDLTAMYGVELEAAQPVCDLHPDYPSSRYAAGLPGEALAVQHHAAHIASVLAERGVWDRPVLGFAFDGTGFGEDGTVWGGEIFCGSLTAGLVRVGHLRTAFLPGGDAASRFPAQAAAGFLHGLEPGRWEPFLDPRVVRVARSLIRTGFNSPRTSSVGRLFDAAAALCGFERTMTFEGQAASYLEALARSAAGSGTPAVDPYLLPFDGRCWDYRPLLERLLDDRRAGTPPPLMAERFHRGLARGVVDAARALAGVYAVDAVVLSGGVWQNRLLHRLAVEGLREAGFAVWWNREVPPGDGGISLGQAALAAARKEG